MSVCVKVGRVEVVKNCLPAIRQISAHDQRDFLLAKLLERDLEGIGLAFEIDEDGCIHAGM